MSEQAHRNVVVVLQKRARFKIALGCYLSHHIGHTPESNHVILRKQRIITIVFIVWHNLA
jgi:hypothetical protein